MTETETLGPVDIYTGNLKVISSGTVTTFDRQPIKIIFGPIDKRLRLIMTFEDDPSENKNNSTPKIQAKNLDPQSLELRLSNFNSPLGSYNSSPINIGNFAGSPLFFNFFVIGHQQSSGKTIHYTLYLGTTDKIATSNMGENRV